ncbi:MAG TPA: rod shape-determining protein MreB [Caldilineaceae bacterium]|nr:rod shape-determining protein MreB [Caldilineaceae bacterium]
MLEKQIGIDLGTVNVLVYVRGRGIVLHEPSVVAIRARDSKMVAVGHEAYDMLGRTPESIEVARPMRDGVIADFVVTEAMLRYFIKAIAGRFNPLFKPKVMISTPRGVTSVEERAVHDAAMQAGAGAAYLIPEPLAAAYGAGLPIGTPTGNMVVDMGGGTTEAAIVSMYDIVVWSSVRVGGNRLDESITSYIRKKYNLLIGDQTAEEIKIAIGSALPLEEERRMEVRGRDQVNGLPKTIEITSAEVTEAMRKCGILEEIQHMPDGLDSILQPGGRPLSASQACRLMLARAIAGKPRLIILDDALDSVDREREREPICDMLFDPKAPWTILSISERPDLLARCNRLLVMEDGNLREVKWEGGKA